MNSIYHEDTNYGSPGMQSGMLALVFALGVQTMVVELSLPRLLAPAFGNTLFCWTAAISEVLAALAVGYQLGGIISSQKIGSTNRILWWLASASSGWVILSGIWGDKIIRSLSDLGMVAGPLVGTLFLAVLPAGLSAAILPVCVALSSRRMDSGRSAGRLYAFSTVGSVIGVLITGYLLLPLLGVSGSLFSAAGLVFVTFLLCKRYIFGTFGLSLIAFLSAILFAHHAEGVLLDKSNGYHRINVVSFWDEPGIRYLYLDNTLEGGVNLGSKIPVLGCHKDGVIVADSMRNLSQCFVMGGGSFSMPKYIKFRHPNVEVDVAEIDPDVVKAAEDFLELSGDFDILIGDARRILKGSLKQYDLIINDAFHGVRKIPFHLVTQEFNRLISQRLSSKGIYAINVRGRGFESRLVTSVIRTLKRNFRYVNHFPASEEDSDNNWILASHLPIPIGNSVLSEAETGMVLTDNHAPVEFLIAADLVREATSTR